MNEDAESAEAGPRPRRRTYRGALLVGLAIVVLGIALVVLVLRGRDDSDPTATITVMPSTATASLWTPHLITSTAKDRPQPAHTMRVVDGEFRVGSTAANTEGTRREVWTMPGSYGDFDLVARIDAPSSLGGASTLQPGIAVRTRIDDDGAGTALVVDANIWAQIYDNLKVGVWRWPASFADIDVTPVDQILKMDRRDARVRAVARSGGADGTATIIIAPPYDESSPYGFRVGDRVDVRTSGDHRFDLNDVRVTGVTGPVLVVADPGGSASPLTADDGIVRLHDPTEHSMNPRVLYPRYVRIRLIGSHLWLKTWLVDEIEPGWQLDTRIPRSADLPETGAIGLVTNHLTGANQYIAFGALEITPIDQP